MRRKVVARAKVSGLRAAIGIVAASVIQVLVEAGIISPVIIPPPKEVVAAFVRGLWNGTLITPLATTIYMLLVTMALASTCGLVIGYLLWRLPTAGTAFEPLLAALFASPIILLYPIYLVLFGRTTTAIIAQAATVAVLPIALLCLRAFSNVPSVYLKVGASFRLSSWQGFRYVLMPAVAPTVFTGIRLGLSFGLISIMAMEFLVQVGGLGRFIHFQALRFDMRQMWAAVILVVFVTAALMSITRRLEDVVSR